MVIYGEARIPPVVVKLVNTTDRNRPQSSAAGDESMSDRFASDR